MTHPDRLATEKLLRNAGYSSRQAKALMGGGWKALVGDEKAKVDEAEAKVEEMIEAMRNTVEQLNRARDNI